MVEVTQSVPRPVLELTRQNNSRRRDVADPILPMTFGGIDVCKFTAPWHVVNVQGGKERPFVEDLSRREIPFFAPWQIVKTKYDRSTRVAQRALFPCYCFISGDPLILYEAAKCRYYSGRLANTEGAITQRQLRNDLDNLYRFLLTDPVLTPVLGKGTRVEITRGPFEGIRGRVVHHEHGRQLEVEIEFMGRAVAAMLEDESCVELVA
jgi:hypothetical protein